MIEIKIIIILLINFFSVLFLPFNNDQNFNASYLFRGVLIDDDAALGRYELISIFRQLNADLKRVTSIINDLHI